MIYPLVRELAVDGVPVAVTCRVRPLAQRLLADGETVVDVPA